MRKTGLLISGPDQFVKTKIELSKFIKQHF